ncbi:hypothetical protein IB276_33250 [Ensifer sp. ENS04]|uniref:hypothetical protein n=1 Tax=Ensifer sp. ENS04 TaxID=2769281 RepID=UPI001780C752|nr:hypothetical protein [Ensifer sp. ENS04]MBD9544315.1 hypothetical protein [Ensifer sp. ENS04]
MLSSFTREQEELLAELYWPGRLAGARNSKARRIIRKSAAHRCVREYFLSQGRVCGNCIHRRGNVCELTSDFYGNTIINDKENDTCPTHTA